MGQHESALANALDEVEKDDNQKEERIRLYQFIKKPDQENSWQLESRFVHWEFVDFNQDKKDMKPQWMLVMDQLDILVTPQLDFTFDYNQLRATFRACEKLWAMKFPNTNELQTFQDAYQTHLFSNMYALDPNEEDSRTKIFGDYSEVFMNSTYEPLPDSKHVMGYMDWEEDNDEEENVRAASSYKEEGNKVQGSPIQSIKVGANDNSYLVKGMQIDVLKNQIGGVEDANLSFELKLSSRQKDKSKKENEDVYIEPKQLILLKEESTMGVLSQQKNTKVYQADIETQKVVAEWGFEKDGVEVPITMLANDSKAAQQDDRSTFLGLDKNRLARWDMRDPHGMVQDLSSQLSQPVVQYMHGKDYTGNPKFCCMSTSGDGFVVVGARDGQLRLYNNKSDKSLNRASTSIPGLGQAITAVDVTYDGRWIVATTDQYIMVVKTSFTDKNSNPTTGFASRMGKETPMPRLLKLKPEDIARVKQQSFHDAKFTWITEQGVTERWIVASCGNFTVLWNFGSVKRDQPRNVSMGLLTVTDHYHLIPKDGTVVDSVFMHEKYAVKKDKNEPNLLVATNHDIWALTNE